jgi:hypothetical protein
MDSYLSYTDLDLALLKFTDPVLLLMKKCLRIFFFWACSYWKNSFWSEKKKLPKFKTK